MKREVKEHSFDIETAKELGIDAAIMVKNFQFWLSQNRANKRNFKDGRYWTYNTLEAFTELFPYWTKRQVRRILTNLKDRGIIQAGNYNKISSDRTKWYTINPESGYFTHMTKRAHDMPDSPPLDMPESAHGLPDTNQDSYHTDTSIDSVGPKGPTPAQKRLMELSDDTRESVIRFLNTDTMSLHDLEQVVALHEAKKAREAALKEKEKEEAPPPPEKSKQKRFTPPSLEDVQSYFEEKGVQAVEGETFWNYYEANGWKVGKNKMQKWKAAASNWIGKIPAYKRKPSQPETYEERNRKWENIFLDSHALVLAKQEEERRNNEY
jgi:hypothetical protein